MKIKYRKILVNISILFMIFTMFGMLSSYQFAKKNILTNTISVKSNDTIWNIAKNICKKDKNLNIQNVIIEIQEINNLTDSDIYVGQKLEIPIY